jgi:hypothetical protein
MQKTKFFNVKWTFKDKNLQKSSNFLKNYVFIYIFNAL